MLMGVGFASLAPTIAFAWNQGFTSTAVLQFVNERLLQFQGIIASGMGNLTPQLQRGVSGIVGGGRRLGGSLFRLMRRK